MSKSYFIVSDVHSFYNEMMKALNDAGYDKDNPDHIFVSLGDLFDRGDLPWSCLKFVNSLPDANKILIRGNHEDLLDHAIESRKFTRYDYSNGTYYTIFDLCQFGDKLANNDDELFDKFKQNEDYKIYSAALKDYYDDGKNVFVHGWIPCKNNSEIYETETSDYLLNPDWKNGDWSQARWINGMSAWKSGIKLERKTIYCGHWHTSWGHYHLHNDGMEFPNWRSTNPEHQIARFDPFIDDGIVALDACCAFSHKINCVKVDID